MNLEGIREAGELQLISGNISGAYKTLELGLSRSEKLSYDDTVFRTLLGETDFIRGNFLQAIDHLSIARKSEGGELNPYIIFLLGCCYFETGEEEQARKNFFTTYHIDGTSLFRQSDAKYWKLIEKDVPN